MVALKKLTDYIIVTEPLLPKETLKEVLATTEGIKWRVPNTGNNYTRTCTTFPISMAAIGKYPIPEGRLEQVKQADKTLVDATLKALHAYKEKHPRVVTRSDSGFDILRYETGQCIGDHIDDLAPRILTMSIVLNDDYTGGEFRFWKKIDKNVPAGCAIIFPPNFMFPHEVLPITSGTRYSMITWFT